jgi:hypothetical protein
VFDLALDATNADLVVVLRKPVLSLRPDREDKYIAPFGS